MPTKTIGVSEAVYERLAAEKQEGESFTDTIARLLDEATADWRHGFGRYAGPEGDALERVINEVRRDHAAGFAARQDEVLDALVDDVEEWETDEVTPNDEP